MAGLALALLPLHEKDRLEQRRPLKHEGQAEPQEEPLHWPWDRTTVPVSGLYAAEAGFFHSRSCRMPLSLPFVLLLMETSRPLPPARLCPHSKEAATSGPGGGVSPDTESAAASTLGSQGQGTERHPPQQH